MNILSLADGISGAQLALIRAGIHIDNYFSSEINKHCITITQKIFPNTIQLGDIRTIDIDSLPEIDLIIGGTPCQGFSLAGKRMNFDDPRSQIFFCFADLVKRIPHKYFIFENVPMHYSVVNTISDIFGKIHPECVDQNEIFCPGKLSPIIINSWNVSAQIRKRLYWTNIPNITQPKDKNIMLKDILESGEGITCRNNIIFNSTYKSNCIDANYNKGMDNRSQRTCVIGTCKKGHYHFSNRVFDSQFKAPTLLSSTGGNNEIKVCIDDYYWRKLSPIECERLQTFPDNYTEGIPRSYRYQTLGNAFTVDVIAHILSFINLSLYTRTFRTDFTVHELENRFKKEIYQDDQQLKIDI